MADNGGSKIPTDILSEIFVRTCSKTLATVKLCGASINSMCKSVVFLEKRNQIEREKAERRPKLVFTYDTQIARGLAVMASPIDPGLPIDPAPDNIAPEIFSNMQISSFSNLISSVNGFTLLLNPTSFQICNPTTGDISEAFQHPNIAPDIQDEQVKIGFGFDGISNRYKLVRFRKLAAAQGTHITVFTLGDHGGDDDWREGPVVHKLEISTQPLASTGVTLTVGNTTYVSYLCVNLDTEEKEQDDWWSDDDDDGRGIESILSFNLVTELASEISLPRAGGPVILCSLLNRLSCSYYNPSLNNLTIYGLTDFGPNHQWRVLLRFDPDFLHSSAPVPIPLHLHGNLLFLAVRNDVIDDQGVIVDVVDSDTLDYLNRNTNNHVPIRSTVDWVSMKPFLPSQGELPSQGIHAAPFNPLFGLW